MSWFRQLFSRRRLFGDLSEEIQAHLDEKIDELVAGGFSREDAAAAARREFGNVTLTEEDSREVWRWPRIENLLTDFRYGLRLLRRSPGFAAVAVLTLALGIGATASIFSVVKAVILNPLPFPQPKNLVHIWEGSRGTRYHRGEDEYFVTVRPGTFYDWRMQSQSFERMSAYRWRDMILTGNNQPDLLAGQDVADQFFETLGTPAQLGRTLQAADYQPGAPQVVVISHRTWVERFAKDPGVIGRRVSLDRQSYEIVGVMPPDFYPARRDIPDLWTAHWADQREKDDRQSWDLTTVARLKPGVTWEQAQIELDVVTARMAKEHATYEKLGAVVVPMDAELIGSSSKLLLLLCGGVALLLMSASVNVANLLLARATEREKEFSVRAALGARRWQLILQLFTESFVMAMAAGAAGVVLASVGTRGLLRLLPQSDSLPRLDSAKVDSGVLAFVCAITLLTSLFFSLLPILSASRNQPYEVLRTEGRGSSAGRSKRRLGQIFVVSEFVFSLVLLILGVVLVENLVKLERTDPGFDLSNLLTFYLQVPEMNYGKAANGARNASREQLYEQLEQRLSALPGVESVALTEKLPFQQWFNPWSVRVEGREPPRPNSRASTAESVPGFGGHGDSTDQRVNPAYFQTLRLKLISGRFLEDRDTSDVPMAAVVNETFARTFFPNENPLGRRVTVDCTDWFPQITIIGVVADFKLNALDGKPYPEMFWSLRQVPSRNAWAVVRTKSDPYQLSAAIRREIQTFDSELPVLEVRSMSRVITDSLWRNRFCATLIALLATLSLVLAGTGIYSVTSYSVSRRTREVGIRVALGANQRSVLGLVLGETCRLAVLGSIVGCAAALVIARLATIQVYLPPSLASSQSQADSLNPLAFLICSLFLFSVAAAASYIPARRATRVDPMVALRCE